MNNIKTLAWLLIVLIGAAACAPAETIALPTVAEIPTVTVTPVPTLVPITVTPIPPSATPPPTATYTPQPSATPTEAPIYIESIIMGRASLVAVQHVNCTAGISTEVRAVVRSVNPIRQTLIKFDRNGIFDSAPGDPMEQIARADYITEIGPFDEPDTISFFVAAEDDQGNIATSETITVAIEPCTAPTPTSSPIPAHIISPTPEYGEELSVNAASQDVVVEMDSTATIILSWTGGMTPFRVQDVTQPRQGTLVGAGTAWIYTPNPGFLGPDAFSFTVWDSNNQASMGTVSITVVRPADN